jgi:hypothetical protein
MDQPILDALAGMSSKTASLGKYEGHGHVAPDKRTNRLRQLIANLKAMLAQFPPEIGAMLGGVISDAEGLAAGGTAADIGSMIAKLERIIELLMQLMQDLRGSGGQPDFGMLVAFLRGLAANLDAGKKAALAKQLQKLRKAAAAGSLKGVDEVDVGDLSDGSQMVEPTQNNVIDSLQNLIRLALDFKGSANPVGTVTLASQGQP